MAESLVEVPDEDGFLDSLEAFAISSSAPVDPNKTRGNKRMLKKAKKKPAKFIKTKPKTATKSKKKLETEKRKELADLLKVPSNREKVVDSTKTSCVQKFHFFIEANSVAGLTEKLTENVGFQTFLWDSYLYFLDLYERKSVGDKYSKLQCLWYDYVREELHNLFDKDWTSAILANFKGFNHELFRNIISCYLESLRDVTVRMIEEAKQDAKGNGNTESAGNSTKTKAHTNYIDSYIEDQSALYRLGSFAIFKYKQYCWKTIRRKFGTKSYRALLFNHLKVLEVLEDKNNNADHLPIFIKHKNKGNLLVMKRELLPYLAKFLTLFNDTVNEQGFRNYGSKVFKVAGTSLLSNKLLKQEFQNCLRKLSSGFDTSVVNSLHKKLVEKMFRAKSNDMMRNRKATEESTSKGTLDREVNLRTSLKVSKSN